MKRFLCVAALLLLFTLPLDAGLDKLFRAVRPLQAMVEQEDGTSSLANICTTTSINVDEQYWLTAAHCVANQTYINGEPAAIVFYDEVVDLAVLKTKDNPVRGLKIQKDPPVTGQHIRMLGHPVGHIYPALFQGFIATPAGDGGKQWNDMSSCGGNSGAAIVNDHDEILSVNQVSYRVGPCSSFSGGANWVQLVAKVGGFFKK